MIRALAFSLAFSDPNATAARFDGRTANSVVACWPRSASTASSASCHDELESLESESEWSSLAAWKGEATEDDKRRGSRVEGEGGEGARLRAMRDVGTVELVGVREGDWRKSASATCVKRASGKAARGDRPLELTRYSQLLSPNDLAMLLPNRSTPSSLSFALRIPPNALPVPILGVDLRARRLSCPPSEYFVDIERGVGLALAYDAGPRTLDSAGDPAPPNV